MPLMAETRWCYPAHRSADRADTLPSGTSGLDERPSSKGEKEWCS